MGIYRLVLAVAVLLSHIGISVFGREIGVIAVISFFIISGYVMTALIDKNYSSLDRVPMFYADRAMRLFPQFLLYSVLTLVLVWIGHPSPPYVVELSTTMVMLNLTMLPLNFYSHFPYGLIIPQAWSLGLESQFYLVIPIIVTLRKRALIFALSAAFFLLPFFGIIDADTWGYRMLPATIFMFLFGSFLRRSTNVSAVIASYFAMCGLFAYLVCYPALQRPYTFEVLLGLAAGVPIVWMLSKVRFGKIEEFAGNLSYGVFLNHFFVIWCLQIVGLPRSSNLYVPALLATSLLLAWFSYELVERRVIAWRRKVRSRARSYEELGTGKPDAIPPAAL